MEEMTRKKAKAKADAIAREYWIQRGAVFGAMQCQSDIRFGEMPIRLPIRMEKRPDMKFFVTKAEFGCMSGSFGGNYLALILYCRPVRKDGKPGAEIILGCAKITGADD